MKTATLTLNPAIDRTMYFSSPFEAGALNRAYRTVSIPGGKGMNVSKVISLLSNGNKATDAISYCFLGGDEGRSVARFFDEENLAFKAVETCAPSRINIKLIDSLGTCTEANEAGGPISENETEQLLNMIAVDAENHFFDIMVLGGSIPQGVDKSVYKSIIGKMREKNIVTVLDCDGAALKLAMEEKSTCPTLIKPNLFELSQFCGKDFSAEIENGVSKNTSSHISEDGVENLGEIKKACVDIFVEKSTEVICTLGAYGSLYTGAEGNFYTSSPSGVSVKGFAGAGDTFLAAYLWTKYVEKLKIEDCLRFASSAASAKVECEGASLPKNRAGLAKFVNQIKVVKI